MISQKLGAASSSCSERTFYSIEERKNAAISKLHHISDIFIKVAIIRLVYLGKGWIDQV